MKKPLIARALLLSAFTLLVTLAQAATLTVSPTSLLETSSGVIELQIAGLATGEKISIERLVDANRNGVADRGETVVEAFNVTDNQAASIGGIRNLSVPGDDDPANGAIRVSLNFSAGSEVLRSSGAFLFRATGLSGTVVAPFTVTQQTYPQTISGTVRSAGTPVAGAVVALIEPSEDGHFLGGTITDANGNYSVQAAAGAYALVAIKPGYISEFPGVSLVVLPGQNATAQLTLELAAGATVSGRFFDRENPAIGVPVQDLFFGNDDGLVTIAFASVDGSYSVVLPAGQWEMEPGDNGAASAGYVGSENVLVNTLGGNVTVDVPLDKGTALFHGKVQRADNSQPIAGLPIGFNNFSDIFMEAFTDAEGNYAVAVLPGQWYLQASTEESAFQNFIFTSGNSFSLSAGQTQRVDFSGAPATGAITGSIKDPAGNGLPFIHIYAFATINGASFQSNTDSDEQGSFTLPVVNGTWSVGVSSEDLGELGFQPLQNQNVTVTGNATVNFVTRAPTAHIRGRVVDDTGAAVGFIQVHAFPQGGGFAQTETDSNGNFDLGVDGGSWTVQLESNAAASRGLVNPSITVEVPNNGEVNNVLLTAPRGTRHIRGVLKSSSGSTISGVWIFGSASAGQTSYNSSMQTGGDGSFELFVFPGEWWVSASAFDLQQRGFVAPSAQNVLVESSDRTIEIVAASANTHIRGRVLDDTGAAIGFMEVFASRTGGGPGAQALTDSNGNFDFAVSAGDYMLQLDSERSVSLGLVPPSNFTVTVQEGVDVNNVTLVAKRATANIRGSVKTSSGGAIPNVTVSAGMVFQGTTYYTQMRTDATGNFALPVFGGTWSVNVSGGDLQALGFAVPDNQFATVGTADVTINFTVQQAGAAPEITEITRLPNGAMQIRGRDTISRSRQIEASINLIDWAPIATIGAGSTTFEHIDNEAPNFTMRFYKVNAAP